MFLYRLVVFCYSFVTFVGKKRDMESTKKKEPVKLRRKQLANGNQSLYLDIYLKGKRKYEFLNLYLTPERNAGERAVNKRTLQLAEQIRMERLVELQRGQFGFTDKPDAPFIVDWLHIVREEKDSKTEHKVKYSIWATLLSYVTAYGNNVRIDEIDTKWLDGFREFLIKRNGHNSEQTLKANYVAEVFTHLSIALNLAVKKGKLDRNPMLQYDMPSLTETERVYLTLEELRVLSRTECKQPELKRAFMFSCLTGLRKSDLIQLQWKHVSIVEGFCRLTFSQWKTKGLMYLDINDQAASYLGEAGSADDHVFDQRVLRSCFISKTLREWAASAGIDKPLTYHSSRHTFAVLMVTLDTDLYTISKLLGHSDVRTTQIYAKVMDKVRREAVSKIPEL